ncbi:MAG: hypothetical protein KME46_33070 [Brasilonema angustatum HA4187-MV1]|jgi:hypothetical protein|nr:hypothetical protein [Brasilonema angustatum HA4187-MV1]
MRLFAFNEWGGFGHMFRLIDSHIIGIDFKNNGRDFELKVYLNHSYVFYLKPSDSLNEYATEERINVNNSIEIAFNRLVDFLNGDSNTQEYQLEPYVSASLCKELT